MHRNAGGGKSVKAMLSRRMEGQYTGGMALVSEISFFENSILVRDLNVYFNPRECDISLVFE